MLRLLSSTRPFPGRCWFRADEERHGSFGQLVRAQVQRVNVDVGAACEHGIAHEQTAAAVAARLALRVSNHGVYVIGRDPHLPAVVLISQGEAAAPRQGRRDNGPSAVKSCLLYTSPSPRD